MPAAAAVGAWAATFGSPVEESEVVSFKGGEGCIQQFPPGHDDDVERVRNLVPPEQLSRDSFGPVPLDRGAQLAGGGNPEPGTAEPVWHRKQGHESAADSTAGLVDALELGPAANPLGGSETMPGHGLAFV